MLFNSALEDLASVVKQDKEMWHKSERKREYHTFADDIRKSKRIN